MEHYKLEYLNDTIRLRITTPPKPGCATTALAAIASVIILGNYIPGYSLKLVKFFLSYSANVKRRLYAS